MKIKIDTDLYKTVGSYAEEMGYSSTEECINHLLEKGALKQQDEDTKKALDRLRGLGYI